MLSSTTLLGQGETPGAFDLSDVVVGTKHIQTKYLFAEGKWSDADSHASLMSTEVHCYKALGFCDEATAVYVPVGQGQASVFTNQYDILKWDDSELIGTSALDCVDYTLRVNFITKQVSRTMAPKATPKANHDPSCHGRESTGFLSGLESEKRKIEIKGKK
jgi:hypothetical protein